jgi:UDP-glucose 4-epimerase
VQVFVTGCAGFIGSHLVDRLLADGHDVVGLDDLSTGQERFLDDANASGRFRFVRDDARDQDAVAAALGGCELVFHLAANADVRHGLRDPRRDVERNTLATFSVLEAMRRTGARRIAFTSSGAVYGDAARVPTPEDAPFPVQTSLYGASKLAAEALLSAYAEGFGFQVWVLRLVSVLGERYSHGHVFDFYKKLRADPAEVEVLGDGRQRKSYVYVRDCVDALMTAVQRADQPVSVLNVGAAEDCTVDDSLDWICAHLGLQPRRRYSGGARGWAGDSRRVLLDTARLEGLGWCPRVGIREGVERTLRYLQAHPWLLERA